MKKLLSTLAVGCVLSAFTLPASAQTFNPSWQTLDLDALSTSPITVSGINTVGQVAYKIEPTQDGTLYVDQTQSGESHIFTNPSCKEEFMVVYPAFESGIPNGSVTPTTYYLESGVTYYYCARSPFYNWETGELENSGDGITAVTFTKWEIDESVPPALPLDQVITIQASFTDAGNWIVYSYEPEADGTLEIYTSSPAQYLFANKGHSQNVKAYYTGYGLDSAEGFTTMYKYPVEAGNVYYMACEIEMLNSYKVMAVYSPEIYAPGVTVEPAEGPYNYGLYTDITLRGTNTLTVASVTLKYNEVSQVLKSYNESPSDYEYQISGDMDQTLQVKMDGGLLSTMQAAGAESFTLEFAQLECGGELLGENGLYTLNYTIPDPIKYLSASSTWPSTFYTYWAPGNEAGMITLAFDQGVESVGSVVAIPGNFTPGSTSGSPVSFDLPYTIEGEKVIINMTGINFVTELEKWNEDNYSPTDPEWKPGTFSSTISIVVTDILSTGGVNYTDGQYALLYQAISMTQSPYPGDTPPTYMSEMATSAPVENTESSPYTSLDTVVLSWSGPVTAVSNVTLTASVGLGTNRPVSVPASIEDGSLAIDLSSVWEEGVDYTGPVTVSIAGLLVENSDGEVNNAQSLVYYVEIEYTEPENPEGEISPKEGYIFTEGEDVVVTVVYVGAEEVTQGPSRTPVIVDDGEDEVFYTWIDTPVLSLDAQNNALVITLGELPVGEYTVTVNQGAVFVDGIENAQISTSFEVAEDSDSINSLKAELEKATIYDLNGRKVNNPTKGIYIINGKKVVIR